MKEFLKKKQKTQPIKQRYQIYKD